jgi:hypothetical protein
MAGAKRNFGRMKTQVRAGYTGKTTEVKRKRGQEKTQSPAIDGRENGK